MLPNISGLEPVFRFTKSFYAANDASVGVLIVNLAL